MTKHDFLDFLGEFNATVQACQSECFLCRAKEIQLETCETLTALGQRTSLLKAKIVDSGREKEANVLLSCEALVNAMISELRMYVAFKEDNADAAWDLLVDAEAAVRTALMASDDTHGLNEYSERLYQLESRLFPKQMFFSIGATVKRTVCTICGNIYGECEHVVGRPYMGELCGRIIEDLTFEEVSLVEEPANKHTRPISITDEHGIARGVLSHRILEMRATDGG